MFHISHFYYSILFVVVLCAFAIFISFFLYGFVGFFVVLVIRQLVQFLLVSLYFISALFQLTTFF